VEKRRREDKGRWAQEERRLLPLKQWEWEEEVDVPAGWVFGTVMGALAVASVWSWVE
jgi:hypothetical protein